MTDRHPGAPASGPGGGSGGPGNLRDSLLKAKIAKLPHLPAVAPQSSMASSSGDVEGEEEEEEEEEEEDGLGSLPSSSSKPAKDRSKPFRNWKDDFSPIPADDCFESALEVDVGEGEKRATFRVYYTPPRIPTAAPTSKPGDKTRNQSADADLETLKPPAVDSDDSDEGDTSLGKGPPSTGTVFLLHHGAGYSALSFALVAKHITKSTKGAAGVLAFDCRGHGRTIHASPTETNALSLENLTNDALLILSKLFPDPKAQPTLILVGHSMGGSVVVSLSHALSSLGKGAEENVARPRVAGVAVLDVVEGTAMAALPSMKTIVAALPKGFDSVEDAIRWYVDSGTIVNAESARRSVASLLKKNEAFAPSSALAQEEEEEEAMEVISSSDSDMQKDDKPHALIWRHNLLATEPYWISWFSSMSARFLSVPCARLLLLAGTDRLDKDLMIGQMQGKYQLEVFIDVGHSLQEDAPERTADLLVGFWKRNEMVLPKKAGAAGMTKVPFRKVGQ
ncbi:alpha/beta-hydrolase [Acaromyces ingoldii]|uniref:Protein phosphatase methylesterase 1 n=1 Tax=Acaromyces ingoldii TaxID=215250 RepID=A0A316YEL8_9BASI|nr:alpha/beta-hydrolase [Acaromyces ingoldii]PWN87561.1 alpha/beta-hydrolase [Acaromyces ingoldii]